MNRIFKFATVIFLLYTILLCPKLTKAQVSLPDNVDTSDCTAAPPATAFDIKLKWQTPRYTNVDDPHTHGCTTPLVADLNGDGYPEVITVWLKGSVKDNSSLPSKYISRDLLVWDGRTGEFKYRIKTCFYPIHGQSVAIGDANGDGKSEIYIVGIGQKSGQGVYKDKYVYCYDGSKANQNENDYIWKSKEPLEHIFIPMLADLNNDGLPELVCGGTIFNASMGNCILKGEMEETGMGFGDPQNVHGQWNVNKTADNLGEAYYLFALADMDNDHQLEICAGNKIYKTKITNALGTIGNTWTVLRTGDVSQLPYQDMTDGQTIVLDFDNDGDLDVCVLGRRTDQIPSSDFPGGKNHLGLYVWDGQTSELLGYHTCNPKTYSQSVPFAGDIDGDGYPEIIFNGWILGYHWLQSPTYTDMMHIFKYQKDWTDNEDNTKSWNIKRMFNRTQTKEYSESAGFTVFDFNQDGAAEIVFRGSSSMYILDGKTLKKLCLPINAISGTMAEYPIIADVDCDGHADIIVTEQYNSDNQQGMVSVYESKTPGAWGPARKIWNQWPYNVVNINEDCTVPKYQFDVSTVFPNGKKPFNSFLQQATMLNIEGDMYVPSADAFIVPDTAALTTYCDSITLDITFSNDGSQQIFAPYGLTIYADQYKDGEIIYKKMYEEDLKVNDTIHLHLTYTEPDLALWAPVSQFVIAINDVGEGISTEGNQQSECDTTNNLLICPFTGFRLAEYDTVTHHMCYGDEYTVGEHIYTETGEYTDTLLNRFGCDSIVTSYLYVHSISVELGPDQKYCSKDYVPVTLDAGAGAAIYEWQDGSSAQTFIVDNHGGRFFVKVYDDYGCSDSDSVNVTIIMNPDLYITQDPEDFCASNSAVLTAHVNTPDATFLWNTGDITPSIAITNNGYYSVTANNHDCTATDNISVPECPCEVWMPNAFTPNGDGLNEGYRPQISNNLKSYQLQIFNRWGELIFSTTDPDITWDGTYKGREVSSNVFVYILNYVCSNSDTKVMKRGTITIVR